jgi:hypothetical protein
MATKIEEQNRVPPLDEIARMLLIALEAVAESVHDDDGR